MVKNTPAQREKQTEFYAYATKLMREHKARLEGEIQFARKMLADKVIGNDPYAKNLLKGAIIQLGIVNKQIQNDIQENVAAFNRGEINKFW